MSKSTITIVRDSQGRFAKATASFSGPPVSVPSLIPTVADFDSEYEEGPNDVRFDPAPQFQDGPMKLRVHVVPRIVSDNVINGENKPVFMIRNDADPRNAIQCLSVRFTGEVRGVFDASNRLRGSQTAAWMETDSPVYVTNEDGFEWLLDSQDEWKYNRNFDYDTNLTYACGNAPSDYETPKPAPVVVKAPEPYQWVSKPFGC